MKINSVNKLGIYSYTGGKRNYDQRFSGWSARGQWKAPQAKCIALGDDTGSSESERIIKKKKKGNKQKSNLILRKQRKTHDWRQRPKMMKSCVLTRGQGLKKKNLKILLVTSCSLFLILYSSAVYEEIIRMSVVWAYYPIRCTAGSQILQAYMYPNFTYETWEEGERAGMRKTSHYWNISLYVTRPYWIVLQRRVKKKNVYSLYNFSFRRISNLHSWCLCNPTMTA